jgi:hypothetical protein
MLFSLLRDWLVLVRSFPSEALPVRATRFAGGLRRLLLSASLPGDARKTRRRRANSKGAVTLNAD